MRAVYDKQMGRTGVRVGGLAGWGGGRSSSSSSRASLSFGFRMCQGRAHKGTEGREGPRVPLTLILEEGGDDDGCCTGSSREEGGAAA